jgi:hypothetical protein
MSVVEALVVLRRFGITEEALPLLAQAVQTLAAADAMSDPRRARPSILPPRLRQAMLCPNAQHSTHSSMESAGANYPRSAVPCRASGAQRLVRPVRASCARRKRRAPEPRGSGQAPELPPNAPGGKPERGGC